MSKVRKRNIIIGSLCAVVLLMAVGYAAFSTVLNIQGTTNISSNWNIKITNVTTKNIVGTASNNGNPTFTDTSATFKTNLQSPGDSLEYEVTVTNAGNLNAKVDEITLSDTNNPAIKFTSSGIVKGDVINAGATGTLLLKVEYLSSVTSDPTSKISNLTLTLDYSQSTKADNVGTLSGKLLSGGKVLLLNNINICNITLTSIETSELYEANYDSQTGVYAFSNIPKGTYNLGIFIMTSGNGYSGNESNVIINSGDNIKDLNLNCSTQSGDVC